MAKKKQTKKTQRRSGKKRYRSLNPRLLPKREAQAIGERLARLTADCGGELTPMEVLEDARSARSPLHRYFEWDDTEAAQRYRIDQARKLIRTVAEVVIVEGKQDNCRSFFNVTTKSGDQAYVTLTKAVTCPNYTAQVLDDCLSYIAHFQRVLQMLRKQMK